MNLQEELLPTERGFWTAAAGARAITVGAYPCARLRPAIKANGGA
jgi:hypothetical protein